jgi:hypothetical protein
MILEPVTKPNQLMAHQLRRCEFLTRPGERIDEVDREL